MIAPSVWFQYLVPQHWLSRVAGKVAKCPWSWVRLPLIHLFIRVFDVDMRDAAREQPSSYGSFNDFFTRALKPPARRICDEPRALVSPVDGTISQIGYLTGDEILQAKGLTYSLRALLGDSPGRSSPFEGGAFATLYLSPRDYHRVHAPIGGRLIRSIYLPGRLFSVDDVTTRNVPGLYARNERLAAHFATAIGPVGIVMVGAIIVAGIRSAWRAGPYPAGEPAEDCCELSIEFLRGDEIGRFCLGSTVIILTPRDSVTWMEEMAAGRQVRLGEKIGETSGLLQSTSPHYS